MKIKLLILIVIWLIIEIFMSTSVVYCKIDSPFEQMKEWIKVGNENRPSQSGGYTKFEELAGFFLGVGIFVIVISAVVIGIRFMFCNADQKAQFKQSMLPFFIGAILIIGGLGIWKLVVKILNSIV